ncbi:MAG: VanZ family protein [Cetobacterium sp.]
MKARRVFRILTIAIMILIFWFSSRDGRESREQSSYIEMGMKKVSQVRKVRVNVRKNAHLFIYLALGCTAFLGTDRRGRKEMLGVGVFVVLYSISDEYHQSFVPGRGPSILDVGIDSLGGALGIILGKLGGSYEKSNKGSYTSSGIGD